MCLTQGNDALANMLVGTSRKTQHVLFAHMNSYRKAKLDYSLEERQVHFDPEEHVQANDVTTVIRNRIEGIRGDLCLKINLRATHLSNTKAKEKCMMVTPSRGIIRLS